jgi:hypothetical protein
MGDGDKYDEGTMSVAFFLSSFYDYGPLSFVPPSSVENEEKSK